MPRLFPFFRSQHGASKAEYILVVGSIAILAIGAFMYFGDINRQHAGNLARELGGVGSEAVSHRGAEHSNSALSAATGNSSGGGGASSGGGRVPLPGGNGGNTGSSTGSSGTGPGTGNGPAPGTGAATDSDNGGWMPGTGGGSWTSGLPGDGEGNALWDPVVDPGNEAGGEFCEVPGGNAALRI